MLKNKNIKVGDFNYILNGLDAISSISLLPVFQRVALTFTKISTGSGESCNPDEIKADLEYLFFKGGLLREVYDKSKEGNDLARNVTHHSQIPDDIQQVGELIQEIGQHVFGYDLPDEGEEKK